MALIIDIKIQTRADKPPEGIDLKEYGEALEAELRYRLRIPDDSIVNITFRVEEN